MQFIGVIKYVNHFFIIESDDKTEAHALAQNYFLQYFENNITKSHKEKYFRDSFTLFVNLNYAIEFINDVVSELDFALENLGY